MDPSGDMMNMESQVGFARLYVMWMSKTLKAVNLRIVTSTGLSLLSCRESKIGPMPWCRNEPIPNLISGVDVDFYCFVWSLVLREEHKLSAFDNRVLTVFWPEWDGVTGEWRRLHNEELDDLYCSPNIIRVIWHEEWDGWGM